MRASERWIIWLSVDCTWDRGSIPFNRYDIRFQDQELWNEHNEADLELFGLQLCRPRKPRPLLPASLPVARWQASMVEGTVQKIIIATMYKEPFEGIQSLTHEYRLADPAPSFTLTTSPSGARVPVCYISHVIKSYELHANDMNFPQSPHMLWSAWFL